MRLPIGMAWRRILPFMHRIPERIGFAELEGVRRQHAEWQQQASRDFARHRTAEALAANDDNGAVRFSKTQDMAKFMLVRDYLKDMESRGAEASRLAMAHRRADVKSLNEQIREARKKNGELADEIAFQTTEGKRAFAKADRLSFIENSRALDVKNGTLGTIEAVEEGRIVVRLDGQGREEGRAVSVPTGEYAALEHGYAVTVHKAQGATVDRSFVLASATMNRHLSYVSLTRLRHAAQLYAGRDDFKDMAALSVRLGRANAKETTFDYAERRGLAEMTAAEYSRRDIRPEASAEQTRGRGAEGRGTDRGRNASLEL